MQVTNYLFQKFDCPTDTFDRGFGLTADSVHFETELGFQFANTQDLDAVGLADQSGNIQIFRGKFGDAVFFHQVIQLTQIEYFVLDPVDVVETTFGDTTLDGHLTTFMRHLALITGPALTTLVTLGRSTTLTGGFTAAKPLLFMRCAFCRLDRV